MILVWYLLFTISGLLMKYWYTQKIWIAFIISIVFMYIWAETIALDILIKEKRKYIKDLENELEELETKLKNNL